MTKVVKPSEVNWDFDDKTNWGLVPNGLVRTIALTLNTLNVLQRCADAQADSGFYFFMNSSINGEVTRLEGRDTDFYFATEAGYYLPAEKLLYALYVDLFDGIDKYGYLYDDDRIILAAFNHVAEKVKNMAIEASSPAAFKSARSEFLEVLYDQDYTLHDSQVAMLKAFPFLNDFECKVAGIGVDNNTYAKILPRMREFFAAMSRNCDVTDVSEKAITEEREKHTQWTQKFDSSNISIMKDSRNSNRSGRSYRFNPQAMPS